MAGPNEALIVEKTGFDSPIEKLNALCIKLSKIKFKIENSTEDTSLTGEKEQLCMDELAKIVEDLAFLAKETADDLAIAKARYLLADS